MQVAQYMKKGFNTNEGDAQTFRELLSELNGCHRDIRSHRDPAPRGGSGRLPIYGDTLKLAPCFHAIGIYLQPLRPA